MLDLGIRQAAWRLGLCGLLVVTAATWARADEQPRSGILHQVRVRMVDTTEVSYWIGIIGAPVDTLLQVHLHIDGGVVVEHIVPDSPAGKAGIEVNDILLDFDSRVVGNVGELAEAVNATGDREVDVTVLHAGKKKSLKLRPVERPETMPVPAPLIPPPAELGRVKEWFKQLEEGRLGDGAQGMFFVRPGIVMPREEADRARAKIQWSLDLPKNTTITITRPNDEPARIVVRQGDKSWEVTAEKLDELPGDLRKSVESLLKNARRPAIWFGSDIQWFDEPPAAEDTEADSSETPAEDNPPQSESQRMQRELQKLQQQMLEQQHRLQEQMEKLQKQIERSGEQSS